MMTQKNGFDRYSNIVYEDITNLFWGIYPYKVQVAHGITCENPWRWEDKHECNERYRKAKLKFYYRRARHLPEDRTAFKVSDNSRGGTFSFFFKNEADALHFIAKNKRHVRNVVRPSAGEADALLAANDGASIRSVVRPHLFWGKYRYQIEFKRLYADADKARLDEWFEEYFS